MLVIVDFILVHVQKVVTGCTGVETWHLGWFTFGVKSFSNYLKWMVQYHKDVYKISRLRLEYAYLLFNKFIMNRINLELIKIGRILMSFLVTESSCDDTSRANKKNPQSNFKEIRK